MSHNINPPQTANPPQFQIHGQERKALKRELSRQKYFLKNRSDLEDLLHVYEGRTLTDEEKNWYNETKLKVKNLEILLAVPYTIPN